MREIRSTLAIPLLGAVAAVQGQPLDPPVVPSPCTEWLTDTSGPGAWDAQYGKYRETVDRLLRTTPVFFAHDHCFSSKDLEALRKRVQFRMVNATTDGAQWLGGHWISRGETSRDDNYWNPAAAESWRRRGDEAVRHLWDQAKGAHVRVITSVDDFERAIHDGAPGVVIGFEGGRPLGFPTDIAQNFDYFSSVGLRSLQPVWDAGNSLFDGKGNAKHLNRTGYSAISTLNRQRAVLDLSHLDGPAFREALDYQVASYFPARPPPVLISHTALDAQLVTDLTGRKSPCPIPARAVAITRPVVHCDTPGADLCTCVRGYLPLTYGAICQIEALDGVIALHFMTHVLEAAGYKKPVTLEAVVNQIDYVKQLVGSRHVALGPDYFGVQGVEGGTNYTWVEGGRWTDNVARNVAALLCDRGFYEDEIRDVLGRNLVELYEAVWSGKARPDTPAGLRRKAEKHLKCTPDSAVGRAIEGATYSLAQP